MFNKFRNLNYTSETYEFKVQAHKLIQKKPCLNSNEVEHNAN